MNNQTKSIGELMQNAQHNSLRTIAVAMAVVLYGAVLVFTGVHNFNLMSRTVAADQQLFALVALACLEGASVFLPIAIHFWLSPGTQRSIGYAGYGMNFAILIANTVLDAAFNRGVQLPQWVELYAAFIMPSAPILIGAIVALLFLSDPSKKVRDVRLAMDGALTLGYANRLSASLTDSALNGLVGEAAARDALAMTRAHFGITDSGFTVIQPHATPRPEPLQYAAQPAAAAKLADADVTLTRADYAALMDRIAAIEQSGAGASASKSGG